LTGAGRLISYAFSREEKNEYGARLAVRLERQIPGKKDEECAKNEPVRKEPNAIGHKA
jgi:hypothetical protein